MKKYFLLPFMALALLTSCVGKKEFAALQTNYNDLQKEYQDAQIKLAESKATIKSLEDRLAEAQRQNNQLRADYKALQRSLDKSLASNKEGNINISKLVLK